MGPIIFLGSDNRLEGKEGVPNLSGADIRLKVVESEKVCPSLKVPGMTVTCNLTATAAGCSRYVDCAGGVPGGLCRLCDRVGLCAKAGTMHWMGGEY